MGYSAYVHNSMIKENSYLSMKMENNELPLYKNIKSILPRPLWENHQPAIECYWKAWKLAFENLKKPTQENGFVANYIDTAFNNCLFIWDSSFILMFAKYGFRAFNFQRTLDNLYAKQHPDGFICREINETNGEDQFCRFNPASTGPNVMPWSEWEYYCIFGDKKRLTRVFPVLVSYHRWLRNYRTWRDGSYWSSGWGCGMDNQPRIHEKFNYNISYKDLQSFYHGHLVWLDTCIQQVLSAKQLLKMAKILGRSDEVEDFEKEAKFLSDYINDRLWDEKTSFYYDMNADEKLSNVKSIGAYWALLADIVPGERLEGFIEHLNNKEEFNRIHRIPTLSADHCKYESKGGYWLGGVWCPTNYMVLRGLNQAGYNSLAHEIALNHLENVVSVYEKTGTIWENYAPDYVGAGTPAKSEFVGWSGLAPIAVLFEQVFGLQPDIENNRLIWDIRLLDEHGVMQYPFGNKGIVNLKCLSRSSFRNKPSIQASSNIPLELMVIWNENEAEFYKI